MDKWILVDACGQQATIWNIVGGWGGVAPHRLLLANLRLLVFPEFRVSREIRLPITQWLANRWVQYSRESEVEMSNLTKTMLAVFFLLEECSHVGP